MGTLTKPVGVCTTNVIGSSVKFACENGVIQEHVFIDATAGNAPKTPDCSGPKKYVMPIKNGCNNYNWGNMYMAWKGFCEVGKGDGKGDGKSGAGGLRIRSPHATIEMGGDVKLFRAGANALTVDATVNVKGSVSAKSVKIGGVPLDDYIRKLVIAMLEKQKSKKIN